MMTYKEKTLCALSHIKVLPGTFNLSGYHTKVIEEQIQPGDILLKGYTKYLDYYFRPGKFHHAAIAMHKGYLGIMYTNGVIAEDIITYCRCDNIAIMRVDMLLPDAQEHIDKAIRRVYQFIELCHSFDCDLDGVEERRYSLNLINMCYKELIPERTNNKLRDSTFLDNKKFKLVYSNILEPI